jgi:hypothetical protein
MEGDPREALEPQPTTPLEAREVERGIQKKIMGVELGFVSRIYREKGGDLYGLLDKYTNVVELVARERGMPEAMLPVIKGDVRRKLEALQDSRVEDVGSGILKAIYEACPDIGETQEQVLAENEKWVGDFIAEVGEARVDQAEAWGIGEREGYVELHFPVKAVEQARGMKEVGLKESLGRVAAFIVEEHPETRAVTGCSWLVSHPVAKKMGFEVTGVASPEKAAAGGKNPFKTMAYWLQLVDSKGNIRQEAVEHFYEHGKLPYDLAYGRMDVEDFLQKYLPDEMRGEVTLKELSREYRESVEALRSEVRYLRREWEGAGLDGLEQMVQEGLPVLKAVLDKGGKWNEFYQILRRAKEAGLGLEGLRMDPELQGFFGGFEQDIEEYVEGRKYVEKRIVVE